MKKKFENASTFSEKDAIKVNSVGEEYMYIGNLECPSCHERGTLKCKCQALLDHDGKYYDELECSCVACSAPATFLFDINSFFGKMADELGSLFDD